MSKNNNLHKAKKEANDEFYTQYEDIAKEIEHYKKPPKDEKPSELIEVNMMCYWANFKENYEEC